MNLQVNKNIGGLIKTHMPLAPKNNVLVIILDDIGKDQFACYADKNAYTNSYPYAYTPNIDYLSQHGVRFTDFRITPMCSPSRASLLCGKYPFQHGCGVIVESGAISVNFVEFDKYPAPEFPIIPKSASGIMSAAFAKWHLALEQNEGGTMDSHPLDIGFQKWTGRPKQTAQDTYYAYDWVENGVRTFVSGIHISERTVDTFLSWLATTSGQQYFGYIAFNAAHIPLNGAENWPKDHHGFGITPPPDSFKNTRFRATLENLDYHIGRIISGVNKNTTIIFLSDNGTEPDTFEIDPSEPRYPSGHPLWKSGDDTTSFDIGPYNIQKAKGTQYELGIGVPLIAYGSAVRSPGRDCGGLFDMVDVYNSCLDLLAASGQAEFYSFKSVLGSTSAVSPRHFSYSESFQPNGVGTSIDRNRQNRSYILPDPSGKWKMIHKYNVGTSNFEFYNLSVDPLETTNLGSGHMAFSGVYNAYWSFAGQF